MTPELSALQGYLKDRYPETVTAKEAAADLGSTPTKIRAACEQLEKQGLAKGRVVGVNYVMKAVLETQAATAPQPAKPTKRSKLYTPNPTRGYEVQNGKVKIFLDRKACSRVLTLSAADLAELTNAVRKAS